MQKSKFITQIMDDPLLGCILKGDSQFKFREFIPPLDKKSDEIYTWSDAIIGDYHFDEICINVSPDDVTSYRSPIFMIRLTTNDLSLFDQSIEHFGAEGLEVQIPLHHNDQPSTQEWRKKLGIHTVADKEIKITASKFALPICVLKLAVYTV